MISSIAWLPATAVKPIPRAKPLTEDEIAEARRIAAEDGSYPPVGAGAELYDEDDSDESSEWETDDDDGMENDDNAAAVAKAKAAAKRIKAEAAASGSGAGGKGKGRASRPVGTGGLSGLDAAMAELDMDNYDDDDDDETDDDEGGKKGKGATAALSLPAGVFSAGTQYYSSNRDDPYLKFGRGPKEGNKGKGKAAAAPTKKKKKHHDSDDDDDDDDDDDSDFAASSSGDESDDEDDLDDWQLRPGADLLLLAARNEDDVSHLEVWVCEPPGTVSFDDETGEAVTSTEANVYVHHDVLLAAFPLCLAWLDAAPAGSSSRESSSLSSGSFVAVGTMEPGIEIWDVDEADAVEPLCVLGPAPFAAEARAAAAAAMEAEEYSDDDGGKGKSSSSGNNKKKSKGKKGGKKSGSKGPVAPATPTPRAPAPPQVKRRSRKDAAAGGGHADAVLGLSWNGAFRNVLASASADRTVKIWDLAAASGAGGNPVATFAHHSSKVQSVAFNPADPPILLTGGFDGRVALVDVRCPTSASSSSSSSSSSSAIPFWAVGADVEALAWDPSRPTDFYVAAEDGVVSCFDARRAGGSGGSGAGGGKGAAAAAAGPRFRISAHSKAATALAFAGAGAGSNVFGGGASSSSSSSSPSSTVIGPGLLATGSTDKKVKLWDVSSPSPELVSSADLKVGAVFGLGFGGLDFTSPAAGGGGSGSGGRRPLLAAAGAKGTVAVWDVASDENVARRWRKTLG